MTRCLLKLFLLFYANNTIIISETADDFQKALDELHVYFPKLYVKKEIKDISFFSKGPKPKNIFIIIIMLMKL